MKQRRDPDLDSACRYQAMREAAARGGDPASMKALGQIAAKARRRRPERGGSIRIRYRAREGLWYIDVKALWNVQGWRDPFWVGPFRTARGAATLDLRPGT